jgi:hypothetical protein
MEDVTLVVWVVTMLGGLFMAGVLTREGRGGPAASGSLIPSSLVFTHGLVAVGGAVVWIFFMSAGDQVLAWAAVVVLVVAALLGVMMFVRWLQGRAGSTAEVEQNKVRLAEQQIPSFVVHGHGLLAAVTVLLALLVALGVGS